MTVFVAGFLATVRVPKKLGSAMAMTAPYEAFRIADGHAFIAAGNDALFRRVCEGLGIPDLRSDARFGSNPARVANRDALRKAIETVTTRRDTRDIVAALRAAGAPCSELNDVSQMLAHEQVAAVDLVRNLPVVGAPGHRTVALPLKADKRRSRAWRPPPSLGADTEAVLAECGYAPEAVASLRAAGVVA